MARWTSLFLPGKGGGDGVAYGGKGKGILIHTVTEGSGMPLSNRTTDANGSERDQVIPLVDSVKLKTNKRGISPKPLKVVAADKAYYSKNKRAVLGRRRIRPQ
ncbi:MAG: transposase [Richelia sp.]|nr:transposase [Richelia sp.]